MSTTTHQGEIMDYTAFDLLGGNPDAWDAVSLAHDFGGTVIVTKGGVLRVTSRKA